MDGANTAMDGGAGRVEFPAGELDMEFTGERYVPGIPGHIRSEHYHRYLLAHRFAAGRDVLDIACGEGYGSHALAQVARSVVGVDIAAEVVAHANRRYATAACRFLEGSVTAVPAADQAFDVVACFETLEHVAQQAEAVAELRRVLRPDGVLLISTPNARAEDGAWHEGNPFHVRELDAGEFRDLLAQRFRHVALLEQRFLYGSVIAPEDGVQAGAVELLQTTDLRSYVRRDGDLGRFYLLAVASDAALPALRLSVCDDSQEFAYVQQELRVATARVGELESQAAAPVEPPVDPAALPLALAEAEALRAALRRAETREKLMRVQIEFLRRKLAPA